MNTHPPLYPIWLKLCQRYGSTQELIDSRWQEIHKAYSSSDRHYHNLEHLAAMIRLFQEYEEELKDPDAVLFAIFYHDIVYGVMRQDNEAQSAAFAAERLPRLGVSKEIIERCSQLILATKAHDRAGDSNTRYLLDFDLAILGAEPEAYRRYTEQIRAEYAIYPDELYRPGRKQVLEHFMAKDSIFQTGEFQNRLEERARQNLRWELSSLE